MIHNTTMEANTVKTQYAELIGYISQMGHKVKIPLESQVEITLQLLSYFGDEIITVHLFQPLNNNKEYNYHRLRISWKVPPENCLGHNTWYEETTDQSVIFKRLLFDILNWKIQTLDKENVDSSNLIIYEAIKNWSVAEEGKSKGFCLKDVFKAKVKKLLSIFHAYKNNKYTE